MTSNTAAFTRIAAALVTTLALPAAGSAETPAPQISGSVTGYYYAMRDQPDYGVGVASLNRDALHLEARYNYEAQHSTSLFAGWNFAGGDTVAFTITPILGALVGDVHGVVPGVEAGVTYGQLDAYIEAEYVRDFGNRDDSYFYAWTELGWKPASWMRIGLVAQRSREIESDRTLQRGVFVQLTGGRFSLGVYGFNPDLASRYVIVSLGAQF